MTKGLEIHIIELPRFLKEIEELESGLEDWLYLLIKAEKLPEKDMKRLKERNPVIEEAIEALENISLDDKTRAYYETRLKSERDIMAMKHSSYEEGLKKGIEKERQRTEKLLRIQKRKNALRTAIKLKQSGMSVDSIVEIIEIQTDYLIQLFKRIGF